MGGLLLLIYLFHVIQLAAVVRKLDFDLGRVGLPDFHDGLCLPRISLIHAESTHGMDCLALANMFRIKIFCRLLLRTFTTGKNLFVYLLMGTREIFGFVQKVLDFLFPFNILLT